MKTLLRSFTCAAVAMTAFAAFADHDEFVTTDFEEVADEDVAVDEAPASGEQTIDQLFYTLPCCRHVDGSGEVRKSGSGEWEPIEEGRYYPLGSSFRGTTDFSKVIIGFGPQCEVAAIGRSGFGTRPQPLEVKSRTLVLEGGNIELKVPRDLPEGSFKVAGIGFLADNLRGQSEFGYELPGDGELARMRCKSGSMSVDGRHFKIAEMRTSNEISIRTSQDQLVTALTGVSGDVKVRLDQGMVETRDFETQETRIETRSLEWNLSPDTSVRIHRAKPIVGDKLAVTVMTFDAAGALKNRCAFTEGRHEMTTGELGPTSQKEREEIARQAVEGGDAGLSEDKGDD